MFFPLGNCDYNLTGREDLVREPRLASERKPNETGRLNRTASEKKIYTWETRDDSATGTGS